MNKLSISLVLLVVFSFFSCKKEKQSLSYAEFVKVNLVSLDTLSIDIYSGKVNFALSANVVSPKRLDIRRFGFTLDSLGYPVNYFTDGSPTSSNFTVNLPPFQMGGFLNKNSIIAYIQLENGEIIKSGDYFPTTGNGQNVDPPTFGFTIPNAIPDGIYNYTLDIPLINNNNARYELVDYGVEFNNNVAYDYNGYAYFGQNANLISLSANQPQNIQNQQLTITLFNNTQIYGGNSYTLRMFAVFIDHENGNQQVIITSNTIDFYVQPV